MKVTEEQIQARIKDTQFIRIPSSTVTICQVTLENGFSVRGESACVDPAEFKESIGEKYAYEKAFDKLWELEGFLLAERMWEASKNGPLTFGLALEYLKRGSKVARTGWNGKGLWLELQIPHQHSKMTLPYIYINYPNDAKNTPGARVPWLASQTDMLAEDWVIVP